LIQDEEKVVLDAVMQYLNEQWQTPLKPRLAFGSLYRRIA
jgi:hypothetical protein